MIIIAEAGVNHNGSLDTAKKLIDAAADAGVDYVKFQTFTAASLLTTKAKKADYQQNLTDRNESQYEMIKKLELTRNEHIELMAYCNTQKVKFLSTAFDHESIDLLNELGIPIYKVPSGEITNYPYLCHIGRMGKPVILSTGMANLKEIEEALKIIVDSGTSRDAITVLHCNTEYPTPMSDVNLKAMVTIRDKLGVKVGYSDHTLGIEIPIAATALGAVLIEKHFTLDRTLPGPDHAASLEPNELKAMVRAIRNIEQAMGDGVKRASPSEQKNLAIARKSIVAKRDIGKGELFSEDNLAVKRPGTGMSPMKWNSIVGTPSTRSYCPDEMIE